MIFKLARDRDRDSKDTTRTSAMTRSDGTLVTGEKQVLGVWEEYLKKLLNPEEKCEIEIPHSVKERAGGEDNNRRRGRESCKEDENLEGCRSGGRTVRVEIVKANELVGIKWLTRLFNDCFTTGAIPAEW